MYIYNSLIKCLYLIRQPKPSQLFHKNLTVLRIFHKWELLSILLPTKLPTRLNFKFLCLLCSGACNPENITWFGKSNILLLLEASLSINYTLFTILEQVHTMLHQGQKASTKATTKYIKLENNWLPNQSFPGYLTIKFANLTIWLFSFSLLCKCNGFRLADYQFVTQLWNIFPQFFMISWLLPFIFLVHYKWSLSFCFSFIEKIQVWLLLEILMRYEDIVKETHRN